MRRIFSLWLRRQGTKIFISVVLISLGICLVMLHGQFFGSSERETTYLFEIKRDERKFIDVDSWNWVNFGDGNQKAKVDPRLWEKINVSATNWEVPLNVSTDEDPDGIFRNNAFLAQDDPRLIKHIQRNVLIEPSTKEYNLSKPEIMDPSEDGATVKFMLALLNSNRVNQRPPGQKRVFFEAGALDGEIASRTLTLERFFGWTGLAVEMTPPNIKRFMYKQRKCWFAPVCLSPGPVPVKKQMRFAYDPNDPWLERTGTINQKKFDTEDKHMLSSRMYVYTIVDCFPLYSLLKAAGMTRVDFLNLDLEGVELQVLRNVPFDMVDLEVIVVESLHTEEGVQALSSFMESVGYEEIDPKLAQKEFGWDMSVPKNVVYFKLHQIFVKRRRGN